MTTPEKSAREFLALLPEGVPLPAVRYEHCQMFWPRHENGTGERNLHIVFHPDGRLLSIYAWGALEDHGPWANEIPAPLMERIKEFKR